MNEQTNRTLRIQLPVIPRVSPKDIESIKIIPVLFEPKELPEEDSMPATMFELEITVHPYADLDVNLIRECIKALRSTFQSKMNQSFNIFVERTCKEKGISDPIKIGAEGGFINQVVEWE